MFDFFFFQAEDGIRDLTVTGVQTCALPISPVTFSAAFPYLSLTTAFSSSFAIAVASRLTSSTLDTSAQKRGQSQRLTTRSPDALGLMAATAASISAIASGSSA